MRGPYHRIIAEIRRRAEAAGGDKQAALRHHALMSKKPGSRTYGLRAPEIHALMKNLTPAFQELSGENRRELALRLFESRYEEAAAVGTALVAMSLDGLGPGKFDYLDRAMDLCVNWPMCDGFSLSVLQQLLAMHEADLLGLLHQWNHHENMWKRRASVVTFTRKAGASGKYVGVVLKLCDRLLFDPEELVQKGVGWALKDNLRGSHRRVLGYIKSCRRRGVGSVITLYAVRDLRGPERAAVLAIKAR